MEHAIAEAAEAAQRNNRLYASARNGAGECASPCGGSMPLSGLPILDSDHQPVHHGSAQEMLVRVANFRRQYLVIELVKLQVRVSRRFEVSRRSRRYKRHRSAHSVANGIKYFQRGIYLFDRSVMRGIRKAFIFRAHGVSPFVVGGGAL